MAFDRGERVDGAAPGAQEAALLREVSLFMAGERTLSEAAAAAGVARDVIAALAAEFGAYMTPRAVRALRALGEPSAHGS